MNVIINFDKINKREYVSILYNLYLDNPKEEEFTIYDCNSKTFEARILTDNLLSYLEVVIVNFNENLFLKDKTKDIERLELYRYKFKGREKIEKYLKLK